MGCLMLTQSVREPRSYVKGANPSLAGSKLGLRGISKGGIEIGWRVRLTQR